MSIGFCLWETGAAKWLAVQWLDLFKESTPLRVHPERRLFRDDDDQFHHERCRDQHFPAGGSGTGTLHKRGSGSDPFRIVGCGGNALSTAGRSSPQRDRL